MLEEILSKIVSWLMALGLLSLVFSALRALFRNATGVIAALLIVFGCGCDE